MGYYKKAVWWEMLRNNWSQNSKNVLSPFSGAEFYPPRAWHEHKIFTLLIQTVPGLETFLFDEPSQEDILHMADLVSLTPRWSSPNSPTTQIQKGVNSARADDTKSLKGAVLDWIIPRGETLSLHRNRKLDRGFHNDTTGALLCPTGMDWQNVEWVFLSPCPVLWVLLD